MLASRHISTLEPLTRMPRLPSPVYQEARTANRSTLPPVIIVVSEEPPSDKPNHPFIYVFWDSALQDANQLLLRGDPDEIKSFRWTLTRSFLLHMLWPGIMATIFIVFLVYYPSYMLWFAWIGFILFIFILYRFKEYFDTVYYMTYPQSFIIPAPEYVEESAHVSTMNLPPPPPTYLIANNSPPAYYSVSSPQSPSPLQP